jgi:hypothetical protein
MRVGLVVDQLFAPVPGGTGGYAGELAVALTIADPAQSSFQPWSAGRVEAAGFEGDVRASPSLSVIPTPWSLGSFAFSAMQG